MPNRWSFHHEDSGHLTVQAQVVSHVLEPYKSHHLAKSFQYSLKLAHECLTEFHRNEGTGSRKRMGLLNEWFDLTVVHDRCLVIESVAVLKINLHPKVFFPL